MVFLGSPNVKIVEAQSFCFGKPSEIPQLGTLAWEVLGVTFSSRNFRWNQDSKKNDTLPETNMAPERATSIPTMRVAREGTALSNFAVL